MYSYIELKSKFDHGTNPHKLSFKLENNTWVDKWCYNSNYPDNSHPNFNIILHGSIIANITQDKITLDNCGYQTMTTKDRLCKIMHDNKIGYTIHQRNYKWWLYITVYYPEWGNIKPEIEFYNGITFIYCLNRLHGNGWYINGDIE